MQQSQQQVLVLEWKYQSYTGRSDSKLSWKKRFFLKVKHAPSAQQQKENLAGSTIFQSAHVSKSWQLLAISSSTHSCARKHRKNVFMTKWNDLFFWMLLTVMRCCFEDKRWQKSLLFPTNTTRDNHCYDRDLSKINWIKLKMFFLKSLLCSSSSFFL